MEQRKNSKSKKSFCHSTCNTILLLPLETYRNNGLILPENCYSIIKNFPPKMGKEARSGLNPKFWYEYATFMPQTVSVYNKYFIIKHIESLIRKEKPQVDLGYYKAIL